MRMKFDDLTTVAKVRCMEEFLDVVIPYDCDDVNEGDINDLIETIKCWIGEQFWVDENGKWHDEDRLMYDDEYYYGTDSVHKSQFIAKNCL